MCFISHLYEDISTPGGKQTLPPTVGCWEHCVVNLKTTVLYYCLVWLHMSLHSYFLVQLSGSQWTFWQFVVCCWQWPVQKVVSQNVFLLDFKLVNTEFHKICWENEYPPKTTTTTTTQPYPLVAWLLWLSPHRYTKFCHPTSPENSKLCCKTCSLNTPPRLLNTSPGKTALMSHFRTCY